MLFYETKRYIHLHQQVIQLNTNQYQKTKVFCTLVVSQPSKQRKLQFLISCLSLLINCLSMEFCDLIQTPKLESVILHSQLREPIVGSFCLTFSHIIISERKENFELWVRTELKKKFFTCSQQVTFFSGFSFCIKTLTQ